MVRSKSCPVHITRSRRWRPGTVALREISFQQRSTKHLLHRKPFKNLVMELLQLESIARGHGYQDHYRAGKLAVDALRVAAEDHIVRIFQDAQICAIHAKREEVRSKDLILAARLRGFIKD